jgi:hypothetical protein
MSLFESTENTNYKMFDYLIKLQVNQTIYLTHRDVNKSYKIDYLYDKLEKEIIIIKYFIIKATSHNKDTKFFINVLQILLSEADFIMRNYRLEDYDNCLIDKIYTILKYSNVIRVNYHKYEENNELIYSSNTLLHHTKN